MKILFFGELVPNIVHGISLANRLNIDLLSDVFEIKIVEEKSDFKEYGKRNSSKIKKMCFYAKEIFSINRKNNYGYFYTVFSLSTFGSFKTLFVILAYVLSGQGQVVLHVHRGDFELFYHKNILNKIITKIIFMLINKLIILSDNQKIEFTNYIKEDNIYVLENSLSEEHDFEVKKKSNKNFLYISNYIKEKGIFELLEVFQDLPSLNLECFGGFIYNEKEIRKYESVNIKINRFINGKEKYQKIHEAIALILPSWNEGQPTIILEAMMIGTIVLTTKVGLIGELLGEDYPFYFEPRDVTSFRECIEKFVSYDGKSELSMKLKKVYFEKYSKRMHQKKLKKIFGI